MLKENPVSIQWKLIVKADIWCSLPLSVVFPEDSRIKKRLITVLGSL